jgi:hypothetical protein
MTQDEIFSEFVRRFQPGDISGPEAADELPAVEARMGAVLPQSYCHFIERFGATFTPRILVLVANEDSEEDGFDLQRINGTREILGACEEAWSSGMSHDLVAFGRDSMGNAFCFFGLAADGPRPADAPVFLFETDFNQSRRVAESFTAFLDGFLRFP